MTGRRYHLADLQNTAEFTLIDVRTRQRIETLPYSEAVEKYGDWEVWWSYTLGFAEGSVPGKPLFRTAVWIWRAE